MKRLLIGGAGAAAGLGIAGAATAAYLARMVQGRATGDLQGLLDSNEPTEKDVVVFAGASMVRGRASVDFVDMVRQEFPDLEIVNAGENGDTIQDLFARLDLVIEARPKAVVLLIGTNNVQATLFPDGAVASRQEKIHGLKLDEDNYQSCLADVVERLQREAGALVVLCSLPPLGQDLESEPNELIRAFNKNIAVVAEKYGCTFIDIYADMEQALVDAGVAGTKPYTGKWQPSTRSLTQHFIVGRSYDLISEREGLLLSPDGIHLNTTGAQIVAQSVEKFLVTNFQEPLHIPAPAESQLDSAPLDVPPQPRTMGDALQSDSATPYGN